MLFDEDRRHGRYTPVLILGSASLQLQAGLSESLLGRYELTQLPHWSFSECKAAFSWGLETFLQYGGYPEPARMIAEPERWHRFMIDSVLEPILGKDLPTLRQVTKPALLRQTMSLSLSYPAQEVTLRKFAGELTDGGSVATIKGYLELLEGAFLIRLLYKYSTRPITTRTSSPKILPLCPALISCFAPPQRVIRDAAWRGRVFEAVLGARLSNVFREQIWYWREGKHEVDFVVSYDDQIYGIEVKSNDFGGTTTGLMEFQKRFPRSKLMILNERSGQEFLGLQSDQDCRDFVARVSSRGPFD
jgi:predicted AAA+ superfamily ATPase